MKTLGLIVFTAGVLVLCSVLHTASGEISSPQQAPSSAGKVPSVSPGDAFVYTYNIVNTFPHDRHAFTQGLVFENNTLYEGTGIRGRSSLSAIKLGSGEIIKQYKLPAQFFGEGVTIVGDKIIQLTWKSRIGFVFDKNSFRLLRTFQYTTEGWGITHDGKNLIMSNGTPELIYLDPNTFKEVRRLEVYDGSRPVKSLNELEYIKGRIFANVWRSNRIAIIAPGTGRVTGWINLEGITRRSSGDNTVKTLNGIAYDAKSDRLLVTGKLWPNIYEIVLLPQSLTPGP